MTDVMPKTWVQIQNDTSYAIPPRSIVVVTGMEFTTGDDNTDREVIHHVQQYGCGLNGNVLVTGSTAILAGKRGVAYSDPFVYVAIDTGIALPRAGEQWGPTNGKWSITRGGTGFFAEGHPTEDSGARTSLFLRNYTRAAASVCTSSSSSSSGSQASSGSGSASGSSSGACPSGCIQVVTNVTCSGGSLVVTTACAMACPDD